MTRTGVFSTLAMLLALQSNLVAATPQKGPAFYTDVHGAGALIRCMHAMGKIDPKYNGVRDQAIEWSLRHQHPFPAGGSTWLQNPSAPQGHPSFHTAITTISAFNGQVLLEVCQDTKQQAYMKPVQANIRWLMSSSLKQAKPRWGDMRAWTSRHRLDGPARPAKPRPLLSGHSWGVGSTLDALATYYLATNDESVLSYLIGGARYLCSVGQRQGEGDQTQISWKRYDGSVVMGYCRGNAGTTYGLLKVAEALPGVTIIQGKTIEDVVNASLRFILSQARQNKNGIIWENMNGQVGEVNLGYGRGISGIGYVMWMGQQMNQQAGNAEMEKQCADAARATVDAFLATVDGLSTDEAMTEFVGTTALVETIGACSGISGGFLWLDTFADSIREANPALAKRCDAAIRKVALRLINTAYIVDGNYAWKNHNPKFGKNTVNMAIDHGQTGAVYALARIGLRSQDQRIIAGARRAADFVVAQLVTDGNGVKMPHIVPLDPKAKRVVDAASGL